MIKKILIKTSNRKAKVAGRDILGMNGENLQEVLLFCLDEKIEGTGIVEVELPDETKGMIEVECTEEGYELPVKSSLLTQTGFVKFQLRILHDNEEIFKSEIIPLEVKDSINATETIPEQYPTWIDNLTTLKQELEKAESERVSNENERISAEKTRQENFTKMQKKSEEAVSNIKDLTDKYNENDKQKTEAFNKNFEEKQKAINDNAEAKTTAFGENAEAQTKTFNTNSDDKLAEYNRNHTAKMKEFNDNFDTKTKTFNDNATAKLDEYNKNDKTKTDAYNNNASNKEETFNTNAADKQNEFDENASDKLAEYNQNAKELINKVEQVQVKNEALKAENKLIKEQIPSATASGNNTHIEDSGSLDFDWKIRGGHKQERRKGYNIINTKLLTQINTKGIDRIINDDGSLTIKGTATAESNIQVLASEEEKLKEGNYTFVCYGLAADYYVNIYYVGNVYGENIRSFSTDGTKNIKMILTIPEGKTVNFKIYPFLIKGTYTKETIPTYEQYGVSPSPDYPSEVETVGSNVNILDYNNLTDIAKTCKYLIDKEGNIYKNTATDSREWKYISSNYILTLAKGDYVLSMHFSKQTSDSNSQIAIYKEDNSVIKILKLQNQKDVKIKFSLQETEKIGLMIKSFLGVYKIKLEKGSVATSWSSYRNG